MPAHKHALPSHEVARPMVPAYNRRQDLTLAYGLKVPPPATEPRPEPVRVSSVLSTPPLRQDPAPPKTEPAPRHAHRPRPRPPAVSEGASRRTAPPPAEQTTPAPEPTPETRKRWWVAVVAATALAGIAGAGVWAVDDKARTRTCDAVQTLASASPASGGPSSADLAQAESALNVRMRRLLFHDGLKEAGRGLIADVGQLRTSTDVTAMLAVVASINDHGRAAQRACGMPEKDLYPMA